MKGAATVKGEGSAFNLMNQVRGGFPTAVPKERARFLVNI